MCGYLTTVQTMIKNGHAAQQVFRAIGNINNTVCNKGVLDTKTAHIKLHVASL